MLKSLQFLLTPLREGRHHVPVGLLHFQDISTHAPAGGATGSADISPVTRFISTHAPAGGATRLATGLFSRPDLISTHAPAGGATDWNLLKKLQIYISTHAPAGGATG